MMDDVVCLAEALSQHCVEKVETVALIDGYLIGRFRRWRRKSSANSKKRSAAAAWRSSACAIWSGEVR